MASSEKTQNIMLNQWRETDPVLREDFNADNLILDDILRYAGNLIYETGTYTGTGTYGSLANALTLTFGIIPLVVLIVDANASASNSSYGTGAVLFSGSERGFLIHGISSTSSIVPDARTTWSGKSVSWYNVLTSAQYSLNASGRTYRYLVIGEKES